MTELPVYLYGTFLGTLTRLRGTEVVFHSSAGAIARFGVGSPILSSSLPLALRNSEVHKTGSFFGGLLPEGRGLENLARQAGVPSRDVFGLISYAGRDVAGAVAIGDIEPDEQTYQPLTDADVSDRLARVNDYALGAMGGGGSLAGYQPKTTLAWINGGWAAGEGGAASTHILKPVSGDPEPLHIEAYCLELARRIGLTRFSSEVVDFAGRSALVIERYDRMVRADGTISKVHQEDAAQALGIPWGDDSKFENVDQRSSLINVSGLLHRRKRLFGGGPDDRETLLAYVAFNTAIGNTDAHAKNFSLLHQQDGAIELAPIYDVSAHAYGYDGNKNMAMKIGGKAFLGDVTREHLIDEATGWGLETARARMVIDSTLEQLRYAIEGADASRVPEKLIPHLGAQAANLLDGRAAGTGQNMPSVFAATAPAPMPVVVTPATSQSTPPATPPQSTQVSQSHGTSPKSLRPTQLENRFRSFPELRGVEKSKGAAGRFPELASSEDDEPDSHHDGSQPA